MTKRTRWGKFQLNLFDPAAAKAGKAEGMDRVERGANQEWLAAMGGFLEEVARTMRWFTSDDVWARAIASGMQLVTRDNRAFGSVMRDAAKAGICRKAGRPAINSQRRTLHASPRTVWESLIYVPEAAE